MQNTVVPEFAVSDWRASLRFYGGALGFTALYARPGEGSPISCGTGPN